MRWVVAIVFVLAVTGAARADSSDLYRLCSQPRGTPGDLICTGFTAGFIAGFGMGAAQDGRRIVCLPKGGVSGERFRAIWMEYLKDNQSALARDAEDSAIAALVLSFHCSKSN